MPPAGLSTSGAGWRGPLAVHTNTSAGMDPARAGDGSSNPAGRAGAGSVPGRQKAGTAIALTVGVVDRTNRTRQPGRAGHTGRTAYTRTWSWPTSPSTG